MRASEMISNASRNEPLPFLKPSGTALWMRRCRSDLLNSLLEAAGKSALEVSNSELIIAATGEIGCAVDTASETPGAADDAEVS